MTDLPLLDEGGTGAQDRAVEMLGSGECVFECFDTVTRISK